MSECFELFLLRQGYLFLVFTLCLLERFSFGMKLAIEVLGNRHNWPQKGKEECVSRACNQEQHNTGDKWGNKGKDREAHGGTSPRSRVSNHSHLSVRG